MEKSCRRTEVWDETAGIDRRFLAAADVVVRSVADLKTGPKTLTKNVYFEGADVLQCVTGRFRFTLDGERVIEVGAGETLVTYPGHHVTIEALADANRLVYGILYGDSVADYLDDLGFFHGIHGSAELQDVLWDELRKTLRAGGDDRDTAGISLLTDILVTTAQALRGRENAFLADAIHQIRVNLEGGVVRLAPLCERLHKSRAHLHTAFVRGGLGSPSAFIRNEQRRMVLRLLRTTRLPVAEIARRAGFISMTHFANFMRRYTGKSARAWRAGDSGRGD